MSRGVDFNHLRSHPDFHSAMREATQATADWGKQLGSPNGRDQIALSHPVADAEGGNLPVLRQPGCVRTPLGAIKQRSTLGRR